MWVSLPLLFSDMCVHTIRRFKKGANPLRMMKSILCGALSCFPESPFLFVAWLIVLPCFHQQRIPQETTVIKKYWCWIHLFAFPKWSLAKIRLQSFITVQRHLASDTHARCGPIPAFLLAMTSLEQDLLSCKHVSLWEIWYNALTNSSSVFRTHGKAQDP